MAVFHHTNKPLSCGLISANKKKEKLDGPKGAWCEGATSLRGESEQKFRTCAGLDVVEELAVKFIFTMVAK